MGRNIREQDPETAWFLNKKPNQVQREAASSNIEEIYMNSTGNTTMLTVSSFLERIKNHLKSGHHTTHSLKSYLSDQIGFAGAEMRVCMWNNLINSLQYPLVRETQRTSKV